jgi:hypothetical protein
MKSRSELNRFLKQHSWMVSYSPGLVVHLSHRLMNRTSPHMSGDMDMIEYLCSLALNIRPKLTNDLFVNGWDMVTQGAKPLKLPFPVYYLLKANGDFYITDENLCD